MSIISNSTRLLLLSALFTGAATNASAQTQPLPDAPLEVTVTYPTPAERSELSEGPKVEGIISARSGAKVQVTAVDGTKSIVTIDDMTRITASKGLFGLNSDKLAATSLINGLPVTIKTLRSGDALLASQIKLTGKDLKTATMIHNGTDQRFNEQTAATEALRGRMGEIDQYNIKSTTSVNFETGKAVLSPQAKSDLCNAASTAQGMDNALLLVVGYTDSTGSAEFNQALSEKRAGGVVNYLQQACHWKPYRMLTPTGMAQADPLADNSTEEGKAQNRRVEVNVLVSKGLDGL
ncbi:MULTISPECIES: OmpA family protein [unclassified Sphingobium]|uniref:OmpA family protein n=1 Tax=unclassified Sphingobium TaxID=2611147 RepID=UPI000D176386|nr:MULTISPECIES: OmpA family protein [unclassified Sphingobium]MBG6118213.1 outer membrane protein OmpA-like peptidoglycan-associated protein [Sphingobium sp. JAI105]PSO10199.1 cell envelope biogenesis protein OmpA [Sphingobium sp. AEW4]TWC95658.1 OmpA family protein [Sphingobium sp. AEW010]TWD15085.1 OmpA family protein [Sphingobium sp. AEW013]TWD18932.1 OmpA family protein [Sphingobium sp. AEW001]